MTTTMTKCQHCDARLRTGPVWQGKRHYVCHKCGWYEEQALGPGLKANGSLVRCLRPGKRPMAESWPKTLTDKEFRELIGRLTGTDERILREIALTLTGLAMVEAT